MNLLAAIHKRLKEGGWVVIREGGNHLIWQHPNGATYGTNRHPIRDNGAHVKRVFATITKLEKGAK